MRTSSATVRRWAATIVASLAAFAAQADDGADRLREMLRRTQEALRQAQADNATLTQAKSESEAKIRALTQSIESAEGSAKKSAEKLRTESQAAQAAQDQSRQQLAQTTQQLAALQQRQVETAKGLAERDAELKRVQQMLDGSQAANASCENKNAKLYFYGQEILDRYRHKGFWAGLAQKEPVLGLKEVEVQNVVQEYRVKLESQEVKHQGAN